MRYIFLITVAALVSSTFGLEKGFPLQETSAKDVLNRFIEEQVNSTLECVKGLLREGSEEIGFPSLDPLDLEHLNLDLSTIGNEEISGHINLRNVLVNGITNWDVSHLLTSITIIPIGAKVEITMGWPHGSLSADYDGEINAFGHNIKGSGHVEGGLVQFVIDIKAQATLKVSVSKLSIRPSLESATLDIGDLFVDGENKSEEINEFANHLKEWLDANIDQIDATLSQILRDLLNGMLNRAEERNIITEIIEKCFKNE